MDCIFFFLGVLAYLMSCCLGANYVTVSNDVKVKPGSQQDVTLNCTGSRSDLSFYIKNRIQWDFIRKTDGRKFVLTQSFYQAPNSEYAAENFGTGHLEFQYSQDTGTNLFVFRLSIMGVTHADNGAYRCSLLNEANNVMDWKDVKLTVVNQVESLRLELFNMTHTVLAKSSSPITEGDNMLEIKPGQYMVKCDASGSNPEPIMSFHYNDDKLYVSVEVTEKADKDRMHYIGSFHMDSITLQASSSPQELTCTANIQSYFFPNKVAGISLLVQDDDVLVTAQTEGIGSTVGISVGQDGEQCTAPANNMIVIAVGVSAAVVVILVILGVTFFRRLANKSNAKESVYTSPYITQTERTLHDYDSLDMVTDWPDTERRYVMQSHTIQACRE